jgi:hypothetical protein
MVSCRWIDRCYHRCGPYFDCSAPLSVGISVACLLLICLLHIGLTYRDIIDYQPLTVSVTNATSHYTSHVLSVVTGLLNGSPSSICQCWMTVTYALSPAAISHITNTVLPSDRPPSSSSWHLVPAVPGATTTKLHGHSDVICDCSECVCEASRNMTAWIDRTTISSSSISSAHIRMTEPSPLWTFHNIVLYCGLITVALLIVIGYGYMYGWPCHMFGMSDAVRYRQLNDNEWRDMEQWSAADHPTAESSSSWLHASSSSSQYGGVGSETELSGHRVIHDWSNDGMSGSSRHTTTGGSGIVVGVEGENDGKYKDADRVPPYHQRGSSLFGHLSGMDTDYDSPLVSPSSSSSTTAAASSLSQHRSNASLGLWPPPSNTATVAAISSLTDAHRPHLNHQTSYGSSDMRL